MRVAAWTIVVATLLAAIGLFLPSLEVHVAGIKLGKRATLSLYQAASDRQLARRWLDVYHRSGERAAGARLVALVLPHSGVLKDHLSDVHDAMDTLDSIHDDDIQTAGTALAIALAVMLALDALLVGAVARGAILGRHTRGGVWLALVVALVLAAAGVALHLAWREVAFQINDELGEDVAYLAIGAYMTALASVLAFLAAIALVVRHRAATAGAAIRSAHG